MKSMKITKSVVDALKGGDQPYSVRDVEVAGFSVRVMPTGRRSFYFRYRVGGGRSAPIREPKIGDYGTLTVDMARSIALDWAADVRLGGDPMAKRQQQRDAPTMNDLLNRYIKDHASRHKKASSLRNDTRMIEKNLRGTFGKFRVSEVKRADLRAYHAGLADTPYEANRRLALLSKIFSFAADELEWISRADHPVKGIKRYKEVPSRRYLSHLEMTRLGEALSQAEAGELGRSFSPYAIAALRLAIFTGARVGEILTLRWSEVNLSRGCLELGDSKTGRKDVFLPPAAQQLLADLPRQDGNPHVIVGFKAGKHLINIKDSWLAIRKAAGLADVRIHDLRHTFASLGVSAGMSLPLIGALLGHTSTQTTARYAHLASDPMIAAAGAIGIKIAEAIGRRRVAKS
jgi:integrase